MKRCHKIVLMVLILLTMLSLGYSQLLVKNSANGEILRAIQTGQIGIGTTVLGSDKLTIAGSEKVIGKLAVTDSTILATLRITGNSPGSVKSLPPVMTKVMQPGSLNVRWPMLRYIARMPRVHR